MGCILGELRIAVNKIFIVHAWKRFRILSCSRMNGVEVLGVTVYDLIHCDRAPLSQTEPSII